jgi:uncharacterized repeat protein (TIGR02543 family)
VYFTVSFDSRNGSGVNAKQVASGGKLEKPDDPTKTDAVFDGWYKDIAYTKAWDFRTDVVKADVTLYAKWKTKAAKPAVLTNLVYDGTEQTAVAQGGGYTVIGNTAVNAGSNYIAKASLINTTDYVWEDSTTDDVSLPWTLAPKGITVTANGGSSIYGGSPVNPGLSADGLVNGETESVLTGLSNSFDITPTSAAGVYALTVAGRLENGNYTISGTVDGAWIVNTKGIIVTANGGSSIYGGSPVNPGLSAEGLVNGETESVLTGLSNSFGITPASAAGVYALTVAGTLENGNYTISGTVDGAWIVEKAKAVMPAVTNTSLVYTGEEQSAGIEADAAYTIVGGSATNAGSYTTEVSLNDTNYVWEDGTADNLSLTWTIAKADGLIAEVSAECTISTSNTSANTLDLAIAAAMNKDDHGALVYMLDEFTDASGILSGAPVLSGTTLTYTGTGKTSGTASQVITIASDNYNDIYVTVGFEAVPKITVNIDGLTAQDYV